MGRRIKTEFNDYKKDIYNKEYDFIDYFYEIDNEKVFKIFFDNFIKLNNNH